MDAPAVLAGASAMPGISPPCPIGLAKQVEKHGVRAKTACPGVFRTPLVEKPIREHAKAPGIAAEQVVRDVMLKEAVYDMAGAVLFLAAASNAVAGQSLIVCHGWSKA